MVHDSVGSRLEGLPLLGRWASREFATEGWRRMEV